MTGNEIRKSFLRFFEKKDHKIIPSSSLVPREDPTLLFTNAGMVQFKDIFLGLESRDYSRAATVQKCVRAGGKHNDLEMVGKTPRHHTFFEMMGNFSFGDYFKREAISYAWEYLTEELGLPADRMWITVYKDDDEAYNLWLDLAPVPASRIVKLGEKDNFWSMGENGPCGPCSEIIFDRGKQAGCEDPHCGVGICDCDRWLEIWNLVFMQYDRDAQGNITPLPRPSIDTGIGLERLASILQGVDSNFDTDLLRPLILAVEKVSGQKYCSDERGFPLRVIADHVRACTFLIADGVIPSNEGRGYVLRRILRRAVRFGALLGLEESFLYRLIPVVVSLMEEAYPEISQMEDYVKQVVKQEEERFRNTLNSGLKVAEEIIRKAKMKGKGEISGRDAFLLYDTYGFPPDLTEDMAAENGLKVNKKEYNDYMKKQRDRAREAREDGVFKDTRALVPLVGDAATIFKGYNSLSCQGQILHLVTLDEEKNNLSEGEEGYLVVDQTVFYPEGGGQVGDQGYISASGAGAEVTDTFRLPGGAIVHQIKVVQGRLEKGMQVVLEVDAGRRWDTARNHSATHLLHKALKEVLGVHVQQSGSFVAPEKLRFDFSHFQGLSLQELQDVEKLVNEQILNSLPVETVETSYDEALKMGAIALFGEKYTENVRVVSIGEFSKELCGGTHVNNSSEIGLFKITGESAVGAGMRRIEAVTGRGVLNYLSKKEALLDNLKEILNVPEEQLPGKVETLVQELKNKDKCVEKLKKEIASHEVERILERITEVEGIPVLSASISGADIESLRSLSDQLRNKIESGVVVLGSAYGNKAQFVAVVTKDLLNKGIHAGNLIRKVAEIAGGGGGGRPDMAQAGGKKPEKVQEALESVKNIIWDQLKNSRNGKVIK